MASYSTEELLDFFTILMPCLNEVFTEDVDVSVIKEGYYTSYAPGRSFDFEVKVGDPVQGRASKRCMTTGQEVVQKVSKEQSAFGAPYTACAYPFKNGNKAVGCVIIAQAVDTQEEIQHILNNLAASARECTANIKEIAATTAQLADISGELGSFSNRLTSLIKQADKIVASISSIAKQASLLALNASIEAAHVDALDKGFDVVAGGVHELAVESDESVKAIKDLLNKVQHTIIRMDEKIQAVDHTAKPREASIQEMAKASLDFATMAGEFVGIFNYMSNEQQSISAKKIIQSSGVHEPLRFLM